MAQSDRRTVVRAPFPLVRVVDRELGDADEGPLHVWDIDRTYLDTRFSELRGLAWIPAELAIDKHAIPGSVELLQALRAGPTDRAHRPLWFVSASPPQLAGVLERKMLLDGVEWDGILYKDQAHLLLRREPSQLRNHTAFKLAALLLLLARLPRGMGMHLYGDDLESDPLVYCAFGDVAAGRLRGEALAGFLRSRGVTERYVRSLAEVAGDSAPREVVQGIHIRLERGPGGERVREYGPHVVGYPTWAAAAARLLEAGLISATGAARVAAGSRPSDAISGSAAPDPDGHLVPAALRAQS